MADAGGAFGGIANALNAYLGYRANKEAGQAQGLEKEKQRKLEMAAKGLIEMPDGTFKKQLERDPYKEAGLLGQYGLQTTETPDGLTFQQDPKFKRPESEMDKMKSILTSLSIKEAFAKDKERQKLEQLGKQLPADKVLALSEGQSVLKQIPEIEQTIEQSSELFSPIMGRINSMNPYNTKAQTADAQLRASAQAFGRFMEGGVLRKEDEEKYRRMFPSAGDTPDVAKNKIAVVKNLLSKKAAADKEALAKSGYDTTGVSDVDVSDVPQILRPEGLVKKEGMIPKASAGPKRGTVEKGYKFIGGDPADPSNWEKVK